MSLRKTKTNKMKYSAFCDGESFVPDQGRGQELGEVFSPKELVNFMMDISKTDKFDWEATVFEPGTGTGNFVCEILHQKLKKVIVDIDNDGIKRMKEYIKEYEIRSLLALASITFNDIDKSNVERVKHRLCSVMFSNYMDLFKKSRIKNYYYKAVSDIVNANGIVGDFISDNRGDLLFVRYYRINKNKISRYVYSFQQICENDLFSYDPKYKDTIEYNNWILEIDGHDISKEQPKLKYKKCKILNNKNNESIYKSIKSDA